MTEPRPHPLGPHGAGIHDRASDTVIEAIANELGRARARFGPMHSPHEAIAVIEEEYLELRQHVHDNTGDSDDARDEAIQLAAMAARYVVDLWWK